eukprot:Gb_02976 [translate_table: standard]
MDSVPVPVPVNPVSEPNLGSATENPLLKKLLEFAASYAFAQAMEWYKLKREPPKEKLNRLYKEIDELHIYTLSSLLQYARGTRPRIGLDPKEYALSYEKMIEAITKKGAVIIASTPDLEDGKVIQMYTFASVKFILTSLFLGLKYGRISEQEIAKLIAYKFRAEGIRIQYEEDRYDRALRQRLEEIKDKDDRETALGIYDGLEILRKLGIAFQKQ